MWTLAKRKVGWENVQNWLTLTDSRTCMMTKKIKSNQFDCLSHLRADITLVISISLTAINPRSAFRPYVRNFCLNYWVPFLNWYSFSVRIVLNNQLDRKDIDELEKKKNQWNFCLFSLPAPHRYFLFVLKIQFSSSGYFFVPLPAVLSLVHVEWGRKKQNSRTHTATYKED